MVPDERATVPAVPLWHEGRAGFDLSSLLIRPAWHARALCREYPNVNFFPGSGESADRAKEVCARCVVAQECLEFALANHEVAGVWAGLRAPYLRPNLTVSPRRPADSGSRNEPN